LYMITMFTSEQIFHSEVSVSTPRTVTIYHFSIIK
jgi:hypothetical protein